MHYRETLAAVVFVIWFISEALQWVVHEPDSGDKAGVVVLKLVSLALYTAALWLSFVAN